MKNYYQFYKEVRQRDKLKKELEEIRLKRKELSLHRETLLADSDNEGIYL
jgi:hypothetical protein